ncbi:OadG family protein [Hydrogenimonas sp.]
MENMVAESVKYMILGMGIVFIFLYILVLLLRLQKSLIARYFPDDEKIPARDDGMQKISCDTRSRKIKVAAMMAAVHHNRKTTGKTA